MLGGLISGLFNLGGAAIGAAAQDRANQVNLQSVQETNAANAAINAQNNALQREFATMGIQWRAQDAQKAGIHPLAALGAQTHSFAPNSIGMVAGQVTPYDPAPSFAAAGQDIGRAIDATRSRQDQAAAMMKTAAELQLQKMGLENELLASQIAKVKQPGNGPGIPAAVDPMLIDGQYSAPTGRVVRAPLANIEELPLERVSAMPGRPSSEPGAIVDEGWTRTRDGWAPVMSGDVKQRLEEDWFGTLGWNVRNRLAPVLDVEATAPFRAPAGQQWLFNPITMEYRLVERR